MGSSSGRTNSTRRRGVKRTRDDDELGDARRGRRVAWYRRTRGADTPVSGPERRLRRPSEVWMVGEGGGDRYFL